MAAGLWPALTVQEFPALNLVVCKLGARVAGAYVLKAHSLPPGAVCVSLVAAFQGSQRHLEALLLRLRP